MAFLCFGPLTRKLNPLLCAQDAGQPALAEKLTSVGFGIGLEFRESSHVLRAKNTTLVQAGMAFNVVVGASPHLFCRQHCRMSPSLPIYADKLGFTARGHRLNGTRWGVNR